MLTSASEYGVIQTNLNIGVGIKEIMGLTVANNLVDINVHTTVICPERIHNEL